MRPPEPTPPRARARSGSRPFRILGLCAVAAAVAGCGGQAREVREANLYVERVNGVQQSFARELGALSGPIAEASTVPDVQRETRRFQRAIEGTRASLGGIRPPAALAPSHRRLVAAYGTWSEPLRTFRSALRAEDRPAILEAKSRFSTATGAATGELRSASAEINRRVADLSD